MTKEEFVLAAAREYGSDYFASEDVVAAEIVTRPDGEDEDRWVVRVEAGDKFMVVDVVLDVDGSVRMIKLHRA